MEIISIIFVHYATNKERSSLMRMSIESLIYSLKHLPCELIVIDNGNSLDDSKYLLRLTQEKKITHYLRNEGNLWFGNARNQGYALCTGEYLCFTDNDILFEDTWLERCLYILKHSPRDKVFATPLDIDNAHRQKKYYEEPTIIDGKRHITNKFSGSNCWVMKTSDFKLLGGFANHRIAGTKWSQQYERKGYAVISTRQIKARHLGLKHTPFVGYNKGIDCPMVKTFTNGQTLNINSE